MAKIKFYIPNDETIPTDLRIYVDGVYVKYERINGGFLFHILLDDEEKAMEVAKTIVQQIIRDHDESQHGVSWRTVSLEVVPQEEWCRIDTIVKWEYRIRDSY